mgnify:CR=1 FL=1
MDALTLAAKGKSFVLQGPPGTGKSQTITNIIAQAMGQGKKVLFVSSKTAALATLSVVRIHLHPLESENFQKGCIFPKNMYIIN